jgi:hypothetical protein
MKLKSELRSKSLEVEEMRQKNNLLIKDSEIFENYFNSLKSDEVAIRLIIQKVDPCQGASSHPTDPRGLPTNA